jgi:cytoskeletal protein CcmA (bactofilin family)
VKNKLKFASILLLALLVFVPIQSAAAAGGMLEGKVIFGQSYTLQSGETMAGDLLVFGGSATIEKGATVNGSVVLFGGSLAVNGTVNGDVAVTGGSVTLGAESHVTGNLTTVSASLDRADGSRVDGQIYNTATSWTNGGDNVAPPVVIKPPVTTLTPFKFNFQPLSSAVGAFTGSVGMALLAMLVMLFQAPHADRVAHAVLAQPLVAGGLGLLTTIAMPAALVALVLLSFLVVTIVATVPLFIAILIAFGIASLFGWIAIGYEIGQRFTKAIHQDWHPAFTAGLGVFALTLASRVLTGIPVLNCVGWLVPALLSCAGLGAVLMTRFGTQAVTAPIAKTAVTPPDASGKDQA